MLMAHLAELEQQGGHLVDYEFRVEQPGFLNDRHPTVRFDAKVAMPDDWTPSLEMSG